MAAKPTQTSDDDSPEIPDEGHPVHFATRLELAERARAAAFAELGSPVAAIVRNLAVSVLRLLRPRSLARGREEEASDDAQGPNSETRLK